MPRKLIYQIIVIVLSSICLSCETILDTDTSLEKPKLVVNSLFTQDSTWNVSLTWTRNIGDTLRFLYFQPVGEAARVTIYDEHHSPIENLTFGVTDYYTFAFLGNTAPVFGKTYSIQVEVEGEAILKATSYLPPPVPILSVVVDSSLYQSTKDVLMEVVFKDPRDKINYYQVKVFKRINNSIGDEVLFFAPIDPALKNDYSSSRSLLLSDSHFNGGEYRLRLKVSGSGYQQVKSPVKIDLQSVSEEYYKYFTTKNLQINSRLDPFAQPAEIFSNIENGLGIFAGYGSSVVELK